MLILDSTTKKIQAFFAEATVVNNPTYVVTFADRVPALEEWSLSGSTNTTLMDIVPSPSSWEIRLVKDIIYYNQDNQNRTLFIIFNDNGNTRTIFKKLIAPWKSWRMSDQENLALTVSDIADAVSTSRTINTTWPLTGGGDLSSNRTIAIEESSWTTNWYLSSWNFNIFNNKQAQLVSWTNIKTLWWVSLLWSGDIAIYGVATISFEADFGTTPKKQIITEVNHPFISSLSNVIGQVAYKNATWKVIDEWEFDSFDIKVSECSEWVVTVLITCLTGYFKGALPILFIVTSPNP